MIVRKKKVAEKKGRRQAIKTWLKKKFLDRARADVRRYKFRTKAQPESLEEGKLRTEQHAIKLAVFHAIREIYEAL